MPIFKDKRVYDKEIIDLGPSFYTEKEYRDCLIKLDKIGRNLGGDRATLWGLDQLKKSPSSILDVGCGGGLFTIRLGEHYPHAQVLGIDISEQAIQFANQKLAESKTKNVKFLIPSSHELNYPMDSFDVVTSTLVCHHLNDEELIDFLKKAYNTAKSAVIINDLHRNSLAGLCFSIISPLFFKNRLIIHDGLLSIKRGFKRTDWENILSAASIPKERYSITWHWAFRWIIWINTKK